MDLGVRVARVEMEDPNPLREATEVTTPLEVLEVEATCQDLEVQEAREAHPMVEVNHQAFHLCHLIYLFHPFHLVHLLLVHLVHLVPRVLLVHQVHQAVEVHPVPCTTVLLISTASLS